MAPVQARGPSNTRLPHPGFPHTSIRVGLHVYAWGYTMMTSGTVRMAFIADRSIGQVSCNRPRIYLEGREQEEISVTGQAAARARPGIVTRARVRVGRVGLRLAQTCCFLLVLTLVWGPQWPLNSLGITAPPHGVLNTAFDPADFIFLGVVAGWGLALLSGQDRIGLLPRWITGPLMLFALAGGLAIVGAMNRAMAMHFAIRSAGLAVLFLYVHRGIGTGRLSPATLAMWLVPGLALNGLLAIAQFVHQSSLGLTWLGEPVRLRTTPGLPVVLVHGARLMRAFGLLPHANVLGGLLAAALPVVVGLLLRPGASGSAAMTRRRRWGRAMGDALLLLSVALMVAGIVLSFSRSAWLGLLCGGLYLIVRRAIGNRHALLGPYTGRGVLVAAGIGLVVVALLLVERDAVSVRLQPASNRLEQASIQQRLSLLELSFKVISLRPLTGVGGGNFALAADRFLPREERGQSTFNRVHNTYLMAQAELGPLGAAGWLALMLVPLVGLTRLGSTRRPVRAARAMSAPRAVPPPVGQGAGPAATAFRSWTDVTEPALHVRPATSYRHIASPIEKPDHGRGDPRGQALHDVPAKIQWQGPAGCSLIVVAVVGLLDWYIWVNEPVAVLWVVALALFAASVGESRTLRQPARRRVYPIIVVALLAILAAAIGGFEYRYRDRVLPKAIVTTANIDVGGQRDRSSTSGQSSPGRPPCSPRRGGE